MRNDKAPVGHPDSEIGIPNLAVLFAEPPDLTPGTVSAVVRGYHPDMANATIELDGLAGRVAWGEHSLKLLVVGEPMPYGPVESCVGPAMLPPELKAEARRHTAHLLVYYSGSDAADPLEQYVALAAVAGALCRFGGVAVLNEDARAAAPWYDLIPGDGEDGLATLRGLPVPYLWGGFVKLDVGDPARPWARTFANHRLGLPELAHQLAGHHETAQVFQLFAGLLGYLRSTGATFTPGDTIDLGDGKLRLREPTEAEWYLDSLGTMLVVEHHSHMGEAQGQSSLGSSDHT